MSVDLMGPFPADNNGDTYAFTAKEDQTGVVATIPTETKSGASNLEASTETTSS